MKQYSTVSCKPLLGAALLAFALGNAQAAEITVSAAASLTNAFTEIAQGYQAKYPDARVQLNFGASGALLSQISKGAPVDVFASANQSTMDKAEKEGLVKPGDRHDFAQNSLVVIVPSDSKLSINSLEDIKTNDKVQKVAIGNPASVPIGTYAKEALTSKGLWDAVSAKAVYTQDVRQSLDYVSRGEVEAGFVYATDALTVGDKVRTLFEVPLKTPVSYPIARIADSANADEARRFVAYVLSPDGQKVLARYKFRQP